MVIENLSEHELLQKQNLMWLYQQTGGQKDAIYFEYRAKAKKEKITGEFEKLYKSICKKELNNKIERCNFCEFNDERFDLITTGEWIANRDGIFKQVANQTTQELDIVEASRMMFAPTETMINVDTGVEKVKLMYFKHNQWKHMIVEKTTISVNHKIVELSNLGLDITSTNAKHIVDYLYDCLTLNDDETIKNFKSISRMGWHNDEFMPYTNCIKFDGENQNKYVYNALKTSGNRQKWIDYTAEMRKSKYVRLQMAVSLASPLIEKLNILPFILHLWGQSGTGKTVGTYIAMSVWGDPVDGKLTRSTNNTLNSVMDYCAFMKHIPVALDDLQNIKSHGGYDKFVMLICNGIERGRMKYDEAKEVRTWRNTCITSGEEPITQSVSAGGVLNRVIEVDVTGKSVIDTNKGRQITEFYKENFGHVAEEWVSYIVKNLDDIKELYRYNCDAINNISNATSKQTNAMACILVADYFATHLWFKDEKPLTVNDVEEYMFTDDEVDTTKRAYSYIMDVVSVNQIRFTDNHYGEIWGVINDFEVKIQKQKLNDLLKEGGFSFEAVKKEWARKGLLVKNSKGRYFTQTKCHRIKSDYVVLNIK